MRLVVERLFTEDFETLFGRIHAKANDEFGTFAIDKMVEITKNPALLARMPFGKHKGLKFEEILPIAFDGYLEQILMRIWLILLNIILGFGQ